MHRNDAVLGDLEPGDHIRLDNQNWQVGQRWLLPRGDPPDLNALVGTFLITCEKVDSSTFNMIALVELLPARENIYIVQAGDTLSGIAKAYGVTVQAIADANDIADVNFILSGQVLEIPLTT